MHIHLLDCTFTCRSTPVETLHTILLGPYKYLTRKVMMELSPRHKEEVLSQMAAFHYSVFKNKVYGNTTRNCKSFVGRDWAQRALFIITPYIRFLGIADLPLPVLLSQQESRVGGNMPGLRQLRTLNRCFPGLPASPRFT